MLPHQDDKLISMTSEVKNHSHDITKKVFQKQWYHFMNKLYYTSGVWEKIFQVFDKRSVVDNR